VSTIISNLRKKASQIIVVLFFFSIIIFIRKTHLIQGLFVLIGHASQIIHSRFLVTENPPICINVEQDTNEILRGSSLKISSQWYDNINLSYAWIETNETGQRENKTGKYNSPIKMSGTTDWANFTWQNPSISEGKVIEWKIYANDTYGNENVTASYFFIIVSSPTTSTVTPKFEKVSESTPIIFAESEENPKIEIFYPNEINITRGYNTSFLVEVKNVGNVKINNLSLFTDSYYIKIEVIPKKIENLDVDKKGMFFVSVYTSNNMKTGNYHLNFSLMSNKIEKNFSLILNIVSESLYETNKKLLEQYGEIIKKLEKEILILSQKFDTSKAEEILNEIKIEYDVSKKLFDLGIYDKSIENLNNVKEKVVELVKEIVRLINISEKEKPMFFYSVKPIFLIFIFILIFSISVFFVIKKIRNSKYTDYFY